MEEYDPVEEIWTKKSDMPTAREYLAVCTVNGWIYALGGTPKLPLAPPSTLEEYTPDGWPFAISAQEKLVTMWGSIER